MTRDEWSQLVIEWQRPLYNLALRVVGDRDDAADATQEVFMALFSNWGQYDRARPLRPWLYRVAHNVLLNFVRGRRRARASAANVPPPIVAVGEPRDDRVERDESRRVVEAELAALPEQARSLLLLHYYHDLSQVELAEILEVPRTTLQLRLAGALDALRNRLATAGHLAALPLLESVMRETAQVPVPHAVTASLLDTAAAAASAGGAASGVSAGSAAAVSAITIGGIVMSKKIALVVLGVAMICSMGAGWMAAKVSGHGMPPVLGDHFAAHGGAVSRAEYESLRAQNEALSAELRGLAAKRAKLQKGAHEVAASAPAPAATSPAVASSPAADANATASEDEKLDWSRLTAICTARFDDIDAVVRGEHKPESETAIWEAIAELSRLSAAADARSDEAILDSEILRGFTRALFGGPLALDDQQLGELDREVESALARTVGSADLTKLTPAERYDLRVRLRGEIQSSVTGIVGEEQRSRVEAIGRVMAMIINGNRRELKLAVGEQSDEQVAGRIAGEWLKCFRLGEESRTRLLPIAGDFWREEKLVLERYGQRAADSRILTSTEEDEIRQQTMVLQVTAERRILDLLTEAELAAVRDALPVLFSFNYRGEESVQDSRGHGFF